MEKGKYLCSHAHPWWRRDWWWCGFGRLELSQWCRGPGPRLVSVTWGTRCFVSETVEIGHNYRWNDQSRQTPSQSVGKEIEWEELLDVFDSGIGTKLARILCCKDFRNPQNAFVLRWKCFPICTSNKNGAVKRRSGKGLHCIVNSVWSKQTNSGAHLFEVTQTIANFKRSHPQLIRMFSTQTQAHLLASVKLYCYLSFLQRSHRKSFFDLFISKQAQHNL